MGREGQEGCEGPGVLTGQWLCPYLDLERLHGLSHVNPRQVDTSLLSA